MQLYGTCDPPPLVATYLADCGRYHAVVVAGIDGDKRYFFDVYGNVIGFDAGPHDGPVTTCERYDFAFDPQEKPVCRFEPNCGVPHDGDAGPPHCGDGVLEGPGESCDRIVGEKTCASVTEGKLVAGVLGCRADCTFDTSGCHE
ncbi:MAG TPA: hypothetical protein VHE30_27405 [Polyangiaceae bacterium]|nr:hypothetical protein [Polyangiaceae bacterium]